MREKGGWTETCLVGDPGVPVAVQADVRPGADGKAGVHRHGGKVTQIADVPGGVDHGVGTHMVWVFQI
jgi:hypothetical protein